MEKVRILAFDPGTANLGWALVLGDIETGTVELCQFYGVLSTSKEDGDIRQRADKLSDEIVNGIQELKPHYVVIEDYVEQGVKSGTVYKDMSILIENMRITCRVLGKAPDIWTNAYWKKLATGSSGLNKKQVEHFVRHKVKGTEKLGSRKLDTHVWDAVGIAFAKFRQLQGEQ